MFSCFVYLSRLEPSPQKRNAKRAPIAGPSPNSRAPKRGRGSLREEREAAPRHTHRPAAVECSDCFFGHPGFAQHNVGSIGGLHQFSENILPIFCGESVLFFPFCEHSLKQGSSEKRHVPINAEPTSCAQFPPTSFNCILFRVGSSLPEWMAEKICDSQPGMFHQNGFTNPKQPLKSSNLGGS